jgi:hypothetical protein
MSTKEEAKKPVVPAVVKGAEPCHEVKTGEHGESDPKAIDPKNDADDNAPDTAPEVIRLSPEKR